ncbi:hypothetical protein BHM03_00018277 [Ensete ventricosum]|nr:hypothetical protein BHM03_00018277 [Ensete ventricosum]
MDLGCALLGREAGNILRQRRGEEEYGERGAVVRQEEEITEGKKKLSLGGSGCGAWALAFVVTVVVVEEGNRVAFVTGKSIVATVKAVSIVEEREKGYDRFEGISLLNHFEEISLLSRLQPMSPPPLQPMTTLSHASIRDGVVSCCSLTHSHRRRLSVSCSRFLYRHLPPLFPVLLPPLSLLASNSIIDLDLLFLQHIASSSAATSQPSHQPLLLSYATAITHLLCGLCGHNNPFRSSRNITAYSLDNNGFSPPQAPTSSTAAPNRAVLTPVTRHQK